MFNIVPALLVTAVYVGFRVYGTRDRRVSPSLMKEAAVFALCTHIVMYLYRRFWLREGMQSTFGETCPNGSVKVTDPVNPKQTTCVPNPEGRATYKPAFGSTQIPKGPK